MSVAVDPALCPRCDAPRVAGPECPRCGVLYAKARPRGAPPEPPAEAVAVPLELPPAIEYPAPAYVTAPAVWQLDADEARYEQRFRIFAVPVALAIAFLISKTDFGHRLARIFASMWIHELGHATAAWLSGHFALPGPWRTMVGDQRSFLTIAVVLAAILWLGFEGWRRGRNAWIAGAGALLLVQLFCTVVLSRAGARTFITFFGDGGCFVLGALLMATFYARKEGQLVKGWLRWGFLAIGSIAFMDAADTWWGALSDVDKIPFGQIEGVGMSDPVKLTETHGWSTQEMIRRYVGLSVVSLTGVAVVYVLGLFRRPEAASETT